MKKSIIVILLIFISIYVGIFSISAFSETYEFLDNIKDKNNEYRGTEVCFQIGKPIMTVNGLVRNIDNQRAVTPLIVDDRSLIPLRALVEAIGGKIQWDSTEKKCIVSLGTTNIEMWAWRNYFIVNGEKKTIELTPQIFYDRMFVYSKPIAEVLGLELEWDANSKKVIFRYKCENGININTNVNNKDVNLDLTKCIGFASDTISKLKLENFEEIEIKSELDFRKYIEDERPLIVKLSGTIELAPIMYRIKSNKIILGIGQDAKIRGGGLEICSGANNVIIKNIIFEDTYAEAVSIHDLNTENIWIDHCVFQMCGSKLIDIKLQASKITVSWCIFRKNFFALDIGHSEQYTADTGFLKVTLHHNWFDGTFTDNPLVRFGQVHMFNNYFAGNTNALILGKMADVFVDNNYFENVNTPIGYSSESNDWKLTEISNQFVNTSMLTANFKSFDPSYHYKYNPDFPDKVKDIVKTYSGVN